MDGLLHVVQRGGVWVGCSPVQSPPAVPNVTALPPSTASVPTSNYLMWHYLRCKGLTNCSAGIGCQYLSVWCIGYVGTSVHNVRWFWKLLPAVCGRGCSCTDAVLVTCWLMLLSHILQLQFNILCSLNMERMQCASDYHWRHVSVVGIKIALRPRYTIFRSHFHKYIVIAVKFGRQKTTHMFAKAGRWFLLTGYWKTAFFKRKDTLGSLHHVQLLK